MPSAKHNQNELLKILSQFSSLRRKLDVGNVSGRNVAALSSAVAPLFQKGRGGFDFFVQRYHFRFFMSLFESQMIFTLLPRDAQDSFQKWTPKKASLLLNPVTILFRGFYFSIKDLTNASHGDYV